MSSLYKDTWYKFTPTGYLVTAEIEGFWSSAKVELFDACGGNSIDCQGGGSTFSVVWNNLIAGNTYWFRIGVLPSQGEGEIDMCIWESSPLSPTLISLTPTTVKIKYHAPIDPATATAANLKIWGDETGQRTGTYTVSADTVTFTATVPFRAGELIHITSKSAVQFAGGGATEPFAWQRQSPVTNPTAAVFDTVGTGIVLPAVAYGYGYNATMADLNLDGLQDLVYIYFASAGAATNLRIYLRNSNGTFAAPLTYSNSESYGFLVGTPDLNNDGYPDLVITHNVPSRVQVRLNDGSGGFGAAALYTVTNYCNGARVADMDNDGDLDIIAFAGNASLSLNTISILKNNGDGTFAAQVTTNTSVFGTSLQPADLDNDGDMDLVYTSNTAFGSSKVFRVYQNDGTGALTLNNSEANNQEKTLMPAFDFNGDGNVDLITRNPSTEIYLNNSGISYSLGSPTLLSAEEGWPLSGDLDGDGDLDVLIPNSYNGTNWNTLPVKILLNDGAGTFTTNTNPLVLPTFFWASNLTDYDSDGDLDHIYLDPATGEIRVLLNGAAASLACTNLTTPLNGAVDVPVTTDLTWAATTGATGYRLTVGTTTGGTDILNNVNVGNVTTYDPLGDLPYSTTIYVTITPYNAGGDAVGCTEESFTTEAQPLPPDCTTLTDPLNGAANVPVTTALTWASATSATGYRLTVGTTPGGTDILNNEDVGEVTTYYPGGGLPYDVTVYVTITPYNANGDALGCVEESFTMESSANFADHFVTTWKTDNPGTSCASCITIPTYPGETYNYDVDWDNDGVFDELGINGNVTHDYGTPGTYTVRIRGVFPRIYFYFEGDREKILSIDQWGSINWADMAYAFAGCNNLNLNPTDVPYLNGVSDLTFIFANCFVFNPTGAAATAFGNWDLSNVTNMEGMLSLAYVFNQPIGSWNTSNVTNMSNVFFGAIAFNQPIGNWNTSNVTNMAGMFGSAFAFNQPIGDWNTSGVSIMTYMFYNATSFNQPIGNWNTSNVENMEGMFFNASAFDQPIGSWNTANVTNIRDMFRNASAFNQPVGNWNTANVINTSDMFRNASAFNQPLGNWNTGNVIYMDAIFFGASAFDQPIGNWNISNATFMESMFDNSGLSIANYDSTLIAWDAAGYVNKNIGVGGLQYCNGATARSNMINNKGWTFNGDALECGLPPCTTLSSPLNGATNVPVTSSLTWDASTGATGYKLTVGSTPGGTDILNNFDAGNVTTYDPSGNFPANTTIYVTITPYNATGDATGCAEESFTTGTCIPNLVIASIPVPGGTYHSLGDLISHSSIVTNGTSVIFTSDTGVLLDYDFTVETGAVFEVAIQGCP